MDYFFFEDASPCVHSMAELFASEGKLALTTVNNAWRNELHSPPCDYIQGKSDG